MNWSQELNNLRELIQESPFLEDSFQKLSEKQTVTETSQCLSILEILINNLNKPLKIVIMGEVKAGKSTILNSIVGAEISPTDVLETTAAIIEISYAEKPYGVIKKDGKEIASGDAEKISAILNFNRGQRDYFKGSVIVNFFLPLEALKEFTLVDTPGILSVTAQNCAAAKNYVKEADLVLWVLNAHHLGQTDILDELTEVSGLGKPVVGIINRIDQVDGSKERLKQYVQNEMGLYLKEIFCLSAKKAWQGVRDNNIRLVQESGLEQLLIYIREEIGYKAWQVKEDSLTTSTAALLEKFITIHQSFLESLDLILSELAIYKKELELKASEIEHRIESYLRVQVFDTLFAEELNQLDERIQKFSLASTAEEKINLIQEINNSFGPIVIKDWWESTEKVISTMYSTEWWDAAKDIQDSKLRMLDEFDRLDRFAVTGNLKKTELNADVAAIDGLSHGLFIGTAFGIGLASYTTFIGPAATYLSIGTALATYIPPLAITGGLAGMMSKAWQADRDRRDFVVKLRSAVNLARDEIWKNIIEGKVLPNLNQNSERTVSLLKEAYLTQLSGWDLDTLNNIEQDLRLYLDKINRLKKSFNLNENQKESEEILKLNDLNS